MVNIFITLGCFSKTVVLISLGSVAIVEMLLENGANVNAQQTNGITALMIAAEQVGLFSKFLLLAIQGSLILLHIYHF